MELNTYFYVIFIVSLALFLLDTVADLLNMKRLNDPLPLEFAGVVDPETYQKAQSYNKTRSLFSLVSEGFSLLLFLFFWLLGGFNILDLWVRQQGYQGIYAGLIYFAALMLANYIIGLPFQIYSTFVIEEKFGFNKSNFKTFLIDQVKSLILSALIGLPILAFVLWFFSLSSPWAWVWGWLAVTSFMLLLSYVAPQWIMPLFNKFTPLEEGALKSKIFSMAEKCQFPLKEIFIMDGSKRSTKSNAFFTGFGKNKRIALFDTLVDKHTDEELVAVLAHEIGHFKLKHIVQHMVFSVLQMGVYFYLIHLFIGNEGLHRAFGMENVSVYTSILFFAILFKPISKLISFYSTHSSRKHEFEADDYAAKNTGRAEDLVSALKKLSKDNLSHFTPHPFYVWMNYSHPPVVKRIQALKLKKV